MKYYFISVIIVLFVFSKASAEIVVGQIVDKNTLQPICSVHIKGATTIRQNKDINQITSRIDCLTDSLGRFSFVAKEGEMNLMFSYIGYDDQKFTKVLVGKSDSVNIGTIKLKLNSYLAEVVVKGKRKQFYMRGDTIIFDPLAFNLHKGDRIAKLISKLPGVEVNEFGQLSWLGKPLLMIMNEHESLAASTFLTKIDAEAVSDIRLYDKVSEQDTLSKTKVLDVRIKKSWMEKWYGDAGILGQTTQYYGLMGAAYKLSDKTPIQVGGCISDGDNIYDVGRYAFDGRRKKNKSSVIRNQQVATNYEKRKTKMTLEESWHSNIQHNSELLHSDNRKHFESNTENYLSDGNINYALERNRDYKHTITIKPVKAFNWRKSDFLKKRTFDVRADVGFNLDEYYHMSDKAVFDNSPIGLSGNLNNGVLDDKLRNMPTNYTCYSSFSKCNMFETSMSISYETWVKLFKWMRNISDLRLYMQDGTMRSHSTNQMKFYVQNTESAMIDRQYSTAPTHAIAYKFANTSYLQLKSGGVISFRYGNSLEQNYSDKKIFRFFGSAEEYDLKMQELMFSSAKNEKDLPLDKNNSEYKNNLNFTNSFTADVIKNLSSKMTVSLTGAIEIMHQRMHYTRIAQIDTIAHRNLLMPTGELKITHKFSTLFNISLNSQFRKSPSDFLQSLDYVDTSNPLHIVKGNAWLRHGSSLTHSLQINATIPKRQLMIAGDISLIEQYDKASMQTKYDPKTGIYTSTMVNVPGGHTWQASSLLDWVIVPKLKLKHKLTALMNKQYSYLHINENTPIYSINAQDLTIFDNDVSLMWDKDNFNITCYANTRLQHWNNTNGANSKCNYFNYTAGVSGTVRFGRFILGMNMSIDGRDGYVVKEMNRDLCLFDASLSMKMLKGKGELKFEAVDIFHQQSNRNYNISANSRTESFTYGLTDYYTLSFVCSFGKPHK